MARGQRRAGPEVITTTTSPSNGVYYPVTIPDYGQLNFFIHSFILSFNFLRILYTIL